MKFDYNEEWILIQNQLHYYRGNHSGQTIPGASSSITDLVQNHRNGDLIVLHLGTNDLDQSTHVNICDNYGRLLDKIKRAAPNSAIAVTAIANQIRPGSATINRKTDHINRSLRDMCTFDQRVMFFDCNPEIQSSNYKEDGIHFTSKGTRFFASSLANHIKSKVNFLKHPTIHPL